MVTVREAVWSTIMVSGEVKQPGRIAMSLRTDRIVDLIAKAGGSAIPAQDTLVRVTRRGRSGAASMSAHTATEPLRACRCSARVAPLFSLPEAYASNI